MAGGSFAGEGGRVLRVGRNYLWIRRSEFGNGGSGGGMGNFGEAAAGGGALELEANGSLIIDSGVLVSMNGGTVCVNPGQGAYYSGGAGSGGAIRLVGSSVINNGVLEAKGGDSSGADFREPGARFFSNAGGAGGGGRIAFLSDGTIVRGEVNVNGGRANGDAYAGLSGSIFESRRSLVSQ